MKKNIPITFIYKNINNADTDFSIQLLYLFNETGFIVDGSPMEIYHRFYRNEGELLFRNLDELGDFAKKLLEEYQAPKVYVLSVEDYNSGLEQVRSKQDFTQMFSRVGTLIENTHYRGESSGLFGKIFT
jgi:hypothetical protein